MPLAAPSFNDRVAVVTGGASGIGGATVRLLVEAGARVVIADLNAEKGARWAEECSKAAGQKGAGASASFVQTDVSSADSVSRLFAETQERHGRLDLLVNSAAWIHAGMYKPLVDLPLEEWDRALAVNLRGTMLTCRAAFPALKKNGGSIVNISSVMATEPSPNAAAYCSSKAAINQLTQVLALEFAAHKVRVNAVAPGYIDTPGVSFALKDREALKKLLDQKIPLGRLGEPEEIARAVLYLASDWASYVTGTILTVDGGWLLK